MKTKDIDIEKEYNEAIVDCLRILNSYSKTGANNKECSLKNLIDDRLIQPIRDEIKNLVK